MRIGTLAAGVGVCVALLLGACGRGDAPEERPGVGGAGSASPPRPPTPGSAWRPFDQAVVEARAAGLPLLVLVRQHAQPCPPADTIRDQLCAPTVFEGLCVRTIADGGPAASPAERRLVARSRSLRTVPPLLVVATADLDLLLVQGARLFVPYDEQGRPSAFAAEPPLTSEQLAGLIREAVERGRADDARLATLAADPSVDARVARSEILAARGRWEEAGELARNLGTDTLTPKTAARVYDVLSAIGEGERAQALAARMLAWRGEEKGSGWLGLRLLRDAGGLGPQAQVAELGGLIERAQRSGCRRLEACLRALRVRRLSTQADSPVLADDLAYLRGLQADVFRADDPQAGLFQSDLAAAAIDREDFEEAERWIRRLLKEHPDAPEASMYLHGGLDRVLRGHRPPAPVAPGAPGAPGAPERPGSPPPSGPR